MNLPLHTNLQIVFFVYFSKLAKNLLQAAIQSVLQLEEHHRTKYIFSMVYIHQDLNLKQQNCHL